MHYDREEVWRRSLNLQVRENDTEKKYFVVTIYVSLKPLAWNRITKRNVSDARIFGGSYFTKTHRLSITKTNQLMLFRDITAVLSESRAEYITLGKLRSFWMFKISYMYSYYYAPGPSGLCRSCRLACCLPSKPISAELFPSIRKIASSLASFKISNYKGNYSSLRSKRKLSFSRVFCHCSFLLLKYFVNAPSGH